jgi:hypothetical protein
VRNAIADFTPLAAMVSGQDLIAFFHTWLGDPAPPPIPLPPSQYRAGGSALVAPPTATFP